MGSGDVGQFLRARHAPRSKRLRMGIEAIVQQAIDQHYAQQSRPSLTSLADEIAGRCKAAGLPARRREKAIRAPVRARDQVWLVRRREGWRNARSLRLLTGADAGATAPWERVQMDSTPCDIRLVREHDRTVIGRPNVVNTDGGNLDQAVAAAKAADAVIVLAGAITEDWRPGVQRWDVIDGDFTVYVGTSSADLPLRRSITVRAAVTLSGSDALSA